METLTNLQAKEIVSVNTGARMGYIIDLEIDVDSGLITDIIIGSRSSLGHLFNKREEIIIPWSNIITLGNDVILVE
ncbi:YlmC/YmxH family sporulation protein [Amphibacillus sp. MSJ-3]|uniref:YlmC/YmxH family sporulation protein n=1 Tax=Amphibacillus sp. MSJ-3 TaxID=2841505 RepID=UPI001C0EFBE5|nr:YlmC/YmxH family sporulation protein [Amphibacillus sp. MSJ-3]MBU5594635.1 YlmC/YmxH family sporulation protein [Amphibacillus sp. MSJ-3]